jgi:hypothetical protein
VVPLVNHSVLIYTDPHPVVWWACAALVEALRHKTGDHGSIPGRVLGNFQMTYSFWPHSVALRSTQPVTEMNTNVFPAGILRAARVTDSSAVLVVSMSK